LLRGRHRRPLNLAGMRTAFLLRRTATLAVLVLVAGCGGGDDGAERAGAAAGTSGGSRATAESGQRDDLPAANAPKTKLERARVEAQLKFARCMREQGLDFPDPRPNPDGSYAHEPPDDPAARAEYERAGAVCVKHFDAIRDVELTPAERRELAEAIDRDRVFARCMRDRGYAWPDPIPDEGGFRVDEIEAAGIDPESPRVERDERACMRRAGQPVPP
jgi:hypothetical protein